MGMRRAMWLRVILALVLLRAGAPARDRPPAGAPRPFPAVGTAALPAARQLAHWGAGFAEGDAPELGHLCGSWLWAGDTGLLALAADGRVLGDLANGRPCGAVATLPPGPDSVPGDAPRLAFWLPAGSTGLEAGLFTVGGDGRTRRHDTGHLDGLGPVTGLALDRSGTLFVTGAASRDILRLDRDGGVSHQATLPDPPAPGAGLGALVLDPASGDLVVDDGWRLRRVTATGTLAGDLAETGGAPCHLAICGRWLVLADVHRGGLRALHLDRSGAVVPLEGDPVADLGGPLAFAPDGQGLFAQGDGWVTWHLPNKRAAVSGGGAEGPPGDGPARPGSASAGAATVPERALPTGSPAPPARRAALAHFRTQQQAVRAHKKQQRERRRTAARAAAPAPPARRPAPARPRLAGVACLALLGSAALADPILLSAGGPGLGWEPTPSPGGWARYQAEVEAQLVALGPLCAAPVLSGRNLQPCRPDYRASIQAYVRQIQAQVARLFVDPPVLGAGSCRPGEPKGRAEQRIELDQGDLRAAYARLAADGAFLWYWLTEIGYGLEAVGTGLLLPGALAPLAGVHPGQLAYLPAFAMAETGHGLIGLGSTFQGVGSYSGWIANRAAAYQARWERWAIRQTASLLNCTVAVAPATLGFAPPPRLAVPLPALQDALQWLEEGCRVAAQRGLAPPVCAPEVRLDLQGRGTTLGQGYQAVACSSAGTLLGLQELCEQAPGSSDEDLTIASTLLEEYGSQVEDPAFPTFALGNALDAAAEGLLAAGDAALQAGNATGAALFFAGSNTLFMAGNGLFASGYQFYRLAALSRAWQTLVTQDSNALARARLDRAYDRDRAASSGAAGPGGVTGPADGSEPEREREPQPGPLAGPPAGGGGTRGGRGVGERVEPMASTGVRTRPGAFWELLGRFGSGAGGARPDRDL